MSLFNTLHSFWSSWHDAGPGTGPGPDLAGPLVNIDGTPMMDSFIDVLGNPYGVTDPDPHDWHAGGGADMGMPDCGDIWNSGGSGCSGGFGDEF
jgi:hypothetical protein